MNVLRSVTSSDMFNLCIKDLSEHLENRLGVERILGKKEYLKGRQYI